MIDGFVRRVFGWSARHPLGALALCLLVGALTSVLLGQDINWDLLNYHLYNPWAWLTGHANDDVAVAGLQSYYNPLPDIPYYLLVTGPLNAWPRVVAALQGLWYGALIYVVGVIVIEFARREGRAAGLGEALAWWIGVSGSAVMAQAGATFNEVPLAMLVLTAFAMLLRIAPAADGAGQRGVGWKLLLAGLLAGVAVGLKPTAIVYAPALAAACLVLAPRGSRMRHVALFGVAGATGVLLAYGAWGLHLYRMTGNPLFPLFNNVFHSDWVPAINGTDARFRPHGVLQWLFYPFEWSVRKSRLVSEFPMRDGRLAVVWLGVVALGAMLPWRLRRAGTAQAQRAGLRAEMALLLFVGVAYAGWLALFSIYRYLIPVEALSGLIGLLLIRRFAEQLRGRVARRVWVGVGVFVTLLLLFGTHRPDWGHAPFAAHSVEVHAPRLPDDTLVLVVDQPNAFVVPFLQGRRATFAGITWFTNLARHQMLGAMLRERIATHRGPIQAVVRDLPAAGRDLRRYGLTLASHRCRPIRSNLDDDLKLCALNR